jgi:RimJ/RimL family protein N-acetyltransferase
MENNIFEGRLVRLRAVRPDDWAHFHRWDLDTEVARIAYFIPFPRSEEATRKWTEEAAAAAPKDDTFRWVIETLERVPVGSANTHGCDLRNGTFEYGVALAREHHGKGYGSEAVRLLMSYMFLERRYQKCNVTIDATNAASIAMHRSLGFVHEGTIRRNWYTNGEYHDELSFGMTIEEFVEKHGRF